MLYHINRVFLTTIVYKKKHFGFLKFSQSTKSKILKILGEILDVLNKLVLQNFLVFSQLIAPCRNLNRFVHFAGWVWISFAAGLIILRKPKICYFLLQLFNHIPIVWHFSVTLNTTGIFLPQLPKHCGSTRKLPSECAVSLYFKVTIAVECSLSPFEYCRCN